jgi:tellurite resistance protein TehA-like permease
MENTDNILNEMQQQLRQLKDKLEGEKIVNEKLLKNAYRSKLGSLKRKGLVQTIIGIIAMLLCLNLLNMGFSVPFVIATEVMLAFCLVATVIINNRLPSMDANLVTAAKGVTRFKKGYANWLWVGIPLLVVFLAGMGYEILKNENFPAEAKTPMLIGLGVGLVIGGAIGLVLRHNILAKSDETLAQIEDLMKGE